MNTDCIKKQYEIKAADNADTNRRQLKYYCVEILCFKKCLLVGALLMQTAVI